MENVHNKCGGINLKKSNKIIYSIFIVFGIFIIGASLYYVIANNENKNKNNDIKEKVISEISYLEEKTVNIFNKMNQIEYDNYKISVENIEEGQSSGASEDTNDENNQQSTSESSSNSEQSNQELSGEQNQNNSQASGENSSSNSKQNTDEQENNQKYVLQRTGVLTEEKNIDWDTTKIEIESLYTSLPTITLDLYNTNIDQNEILSFNSEIDILTEKIKSESKQDTLTQLVNVYDFIVKFMKQVNDDELEVVGIETKQNILKAYSKLDTDDWNSINQDIQTAIEIFSKLMTNKDLNNDNQYFINKTYIMLNELKNSIEKQDKEIFLIKYEELVEELRKV